MPAGAFPFRQPKVMSRRFLVYMHLNITTQAITTLSYSTKTCNAFTEYLLVSYVTLLMRYSNFEFFVEVDAVHFGPVVYIYIYIYIHIYVFV